LIFLEEKKRANFLNNTNMKNKYLNQKERISMGGRFCIDGNFIFSIGIGDLQIHEQY